MKKNLKIRIKKLMISKMRWKLKYNFQTLFILAFLTLYNYLRKKKLKNHNNKKTIIKIKIQMMKNEYYYEIKKILNNFTKLT